MRSIPLYIAAALAAHTGLHPAMVTRLSVVEAELDELRDEVDDLNGTALTISALQDQLDIMRSDLDATILIHDDATDAVAILDDLVAAVDTETAALAQEVSTYESDLLLVSDERSFTVHSEAEFDDAMDQIRDMRFRGDGRATIHIAAPGFVSGSISIRHPQGERISILGDPDNRESVVVNFRSTAGIYVQDGSRLGMLDGIVFDGGGAGTGITVRKGSFATLGGDVTFRRFYDGIRVSQDSSLVVDGGCSSDGPLSELNQNHGIEVAGASMVMAKHCTVQDNVHSGIHVIGNSFAAFNHGASLNNDRHGLLVERDSYLDAQYAETAFNGLSGAKAVIGSTIYGERMHTHDNGEDGIASLHASVVMNYRGSATDNGRHGMHANFSSYIRAGDAATGNGGEGVRLDIGSTLYGDTMNVGDNDAYYNVNIAGHSEMLVDGLQNNGRRHTGSMSLFGTY